MKKRTKLRQQEINLDDIKIKWKTVDAIELCDLRGVDYKAPRPISDLATNMFAQMRRAKKGGVKITLADIDTAPEVRRMLLDDLDQLGLPFGKRTVCVGYAETLTFFQVTSRLNTKYNEMQYED